MPLPTVPLEQLAHSSNQIANDQSHAEPALLHRSLLSRPLEVVSASGSYLTLSSGRQILDGCAGAAVAVIGHGHPKVQQAVVEQMGAVSYVHTMSYTTSSAERLAQFMVAKGWPFGLTKAFFVGSGSEAMDAAMKLARQYFVERGEMKRTRFVSRRQAYHGNTIGAMSVSSNLARKVPYEGALLLDRVSFVNAANAYRGMRAGEGLKEYGERLVEELDEEFQRIGPETVIAFIAEPVVGATSGCVSAPHGYFEGVKRVCDKHGILLILDEVMCGTGRTGTYFAFEQEGNAAPDIVTVGKGVGGGYVPIAGMLVHGKVVEVLRGGSASFVHGQTYQAHPLSCAAALAVQEVVDGEELVPRCARLGKLLGGMLRDRFEGCKFVGDVRGRGLFWALEFVSDRDSKSPFEASLDFGGRVQQKALDLGLAVYPGKGTADGCVGDHVLLAPPLNIREEDLTKLVDLLKEAYDAAESSL
ncbi:pyridoxal phosphate-dependent transferase [Thelonectria olida]|uniref:Pyridoxal phosphate-dependent transferase n=1 Tax=Thelonectria olida TaxID=1576542 RepID=A0A9P8W134_9HYPO|nr:pyridoxal phosphate-dependent transferase [Thelonectria olida]